MTLERELKLDVPAAFRLPTFDLDGLRAARARERDLVATYVDTADLRILRWGASLRHRTGEGWTVKLPAGRDGDAIARTEHVFAGEDPSRMPKAAGYLVAGFVRSAELRPVARLRTVRREVVLTDRSGRDVALVTDDDVAVLDGWSVSTRIPEVEIELADGVTVARVRPVVDVLRTAGARPGDGRSKVRRALGIDLDPEVAIPDLVRDAPLLELVRAAVSSSVVRLITSDPGLRLAEDAEAVHEARVATRRLRSDLRTFRDVLDPRRASWLRDELRWLGDALGRVRDLDVLRGRIEGRVERLPPGDRGDARPLLDELDRRRDSARSVLVGAMHEARYPALLDALVEASTAPPVRIDVACRPAAREVTPALARAWGHLGRAAAVAEREATDAALHAARIRTKRVRYAAEAAAPVFGKPAGRFASAATELQSILGEHHDAVVAIAFVREVVTPSTAFVAGELVGIETALRDGAAASWPGAWEALERKRLRFWR